MTTPSEKEEMKTKVFKALGSASMCWEPRPSGVFDSSLAQEFGDELMTYLESQIKSAERRGIEKGFEAARELRATGEFFEDMDVVYDKYDSVGDYLATLEGEKD